MHLLVEIQNTDDFAYSPDRNRELSRLLRHAADLAEDGKKGMYWLRDLDGASVGTLKIRSGPGGWIK